MKKDVVIIGGGVIGVCSAYYLWKEGKSVVVIDKAEIGKQCSYGNAGYVTPSHFIPLSAPGMIKKGMKWMLNPESPFFIKPQLDKDFIKWLWMFTNYCTPEHTINTKSSILDLNLASVNLYKELYADENLDFQFDQNGLFMLYNTQKGLKEEAEVVKMGNDLGLDAKMMTADEIAEMEPGMQFDIAGGAHYPEDAHLSPYQFVNSVRKFLESKGVEFVENTEVTGFETSGRKITAVKTDSEQYEGDEVILSTGSWSQMIAKELKLDLPIQPGKGLSITVDSDKFPCKTPFILCEAKVAVTPLGDQIRFGGTMELGGFNPEPSQGRINGILKSAKKYIKNFDPAEVDRTKFWSGYRPCSPDGLPIIGRYNSFDNLIVSTGHAMMGLSLGPISGKLNAELITGKKPTVKVHAYDPNRFEYDF